MRDESNVGSLKGSFYWGFCDWGLEERWKMVKIGGFRDDSEFGI